MTEELGDINKNLSNCAVSPMPGILDRILIKKGDVVKENDSLVVLIAMKMEYVVKASRDAIIEDIFYNVGDNVAKNATLIQFKEFGDSKKT